MRFSLVNALVRTESGIALGRVRDADVMWPDLRVTSFMVRGLPLLGRSYLIDGDSIVKIDDGVIIVRDAVLKEGATSRMPVVGLATPELPKPMAREE